MDDTERMEAVKRAYAEIILNTAAESTARILASEKKAMRLQRSLATIKQDAVDMMLRLKSLMDSKIKEAETRNLLHSRRIQELESQLEKAKSAILSLHSDLEREREVNKNNYNKNKTQQAGPIVIEEEENTSSYYQNVVSTDNSSCSIPYRYEYWYQSGFKGPVKKQVDPTGQGIYSNLVNISIEV